MSDFAKMSDDELRAALGNENNSISEMSTEDLEKIVGGHDSIIEEMHPDISTSDRALIKNFSNSPSVGAKYLKKKYPNLNVKANKDGRILIKRDDESSFKVLDPDTGVFSKDILNDVADIGTDAASGIIEGVATLAGGVAGAGAGGGVGALPGAMFAGGTMSAVNEAMRQKIGQALGLEQNVNKTDVAIAGLIGSAAPVLFGTGQSAKQLVKAGMKEGGRLSLTQAQKNAAKLAEKGALPLGVKKILGPAYKKMTRSVAPKVSQMFSGADADSFVSYFGNPRAMKDITEKKAPVVVEESLNKAHYAQQKKQNQIGQLINEHIRNSGEQVDIAPMKRNLQEKITKLRDLRNSGGAEFDKINKARLDDLEQMYDDAFMVENADKKAVRKLVRDETGSPVVERDGDNWVQKFETVVPPEKIERPDMVDASSVFNIREVLTDHANSFVDPSGKIIPSKVRIIKDSKRMYEKISTALKDTVKAANKKKGITSNSPDDLNAAFRQAKFDEDYLKGFRNIKSKGPEFVEHAFDEKGYRKIVGAARKDYDLEKLSKFDSRHGTNLAETSRLVRAHDQLEKAQWTPRSSHGTTSTSRTLSGGHLMGSAGGAFGPVGRGVGFAVGMLGASPAAQKIGYRAGLGLEKGVKKLGGSKYKQTLWQSVYDKEKREEGER